jgi:hypothetical protein
LIVGLAAQPVRRKNAMKRILIMLMMVCAFSVALAWSQQPTDKGGAVPTKLAYYDTFGGKWLDAAKWLAGWGPDCGRSLECVREIQNGQLRLAIREFGATDSDDGSQYGNPGLYFMNPNEINSITADVTQRSFSGDGCSSTNDAGWTHSTVTIAGQFFNTGSGDYADDVGDSFAIVVDTTNPKMMNVSNWMAGSGIGVSTDMGSYPIGTPLTAAIAWDKANHQFISAVKVKGDSGQGVRVEVPYSVSDIRPPAWGQRSLNAAAYGSNCTSAQTYAQVEVFFDNVMINNPPPPAK